MGLRVGVRVRVRGGVRLRSGAQRYELCAEVLEQADLVRVRVRDRDRVRVRVRVRVKIRRLRVWDNTSRLGLG